MAPPPLAAPPSPVAEQPRRSLLRSEGGSGNRGGVANTHRAHHIPSSDSHGISAVFAGSDTFSITDTECISAYGMLNRADLEGN